MISTIILVIVLSIILKSFWREYEEKRGGVKNRKEQKEYNANLDLIELNTYKVREYLFNRGDFNYDVMDNLNKIELIAKSMRTDK